MLRFISPSAQPIQNDGSRRTNRQMIVIRMAGYRFQNMIRRRDAIRGEPPCRTEHQQTGSANAQYFLKTSQGYAVGMSSGACYDRLGTAPRLLCNVNARLLQTVVDTYRFQSETTFGIVFSSVTRCPVSYQRLGQLLLIFERCHDIQRLGTVCSDSPGHIVNIEIGHRRCDDLPPFIDNRMMGQCQIQIEAAICGQCLDATVEGFRLRPVSAGAASANPCV